MRFGRKKGRDAGFGQQASPRAKRFRWTVSRKIMALGLAGLCAALAVMLGTYRIVRLEPSVVLRRQ